MYGYPFFTLNCALINLVTDLVYIHTTVGKGASRPQRPNNNRCLLGFAVKVFKEFHTSRKKGLSAAARDAVVITFTCFP
jgi:hypothetical protein